MPRKMKRAKLNEFQKAHRRGMRRIKQTKEQRRALAKVLLLQKYHSRAVNKDLRKMISKEMDQAAKEAHKLDAFRVWEPINK